MLRPTAFALLVIAATMASPVRADLAVGSPAPPFDLQGSDGEQYTFDKFAGKRGVVLAWFPKAFTPG
jgi:peroxiredoxin Q/BCP